LTGVEPSGDGGPTEYAAPLGLKSLFGVWFYKYFAPLALGMGVDSGYCGIVMFLV